MTEETAAREPMLIDLALQGGGSHGAFTWGALDRLLDVDWVEIEGISGTSAGAMNAAVLAHGFAEGGREGARAGARDVLAAGIRSGPVQPVPAHPLDVMHGQVDARQLARPSSSPI